MNTPSKSFCFTPSAETASAFTPSVSKKTRFHPPRISSLVALPSDSLQRANSSNLSFGQFATHLMLERPRQTVHFFVKHALPVVPRKLPAAPYKVLDAPQLRDDFYSNLLEWSSSNVLAVGLHTEVYLWHAHTGVIRRPFRVKPPNYITSLTWHPASTSLAVGDACGTVQVIDMTTRQVTWRLQQSPEEVGPMHWHSGVLSIGSKRGKITHIDPRSSTFASEIHAHQSDVLGLKWSVDGHFLASSGSDQRVLLWDGLCPWPVGELLGHRAAVKALGWSTSQSHILASGGGTMDRSVKLWNVLSEAEVSSIDTGSQVCSLLFSTRSEELVTSHGFTENQVKLWRTPGLQFVGQLSGHSNRVLFTALSPDGETVVTAGADQTLKFWTLFERPIRSHDEERNLSISLSDVH